MTNTINNTQANTKDVVGSTLDLNVVTNVEIADITIIDTFELIADMIAFLAILIVVSSHIIKNYEMLMIRCVKNTKTQKMGFKDSNHISLLQI